MSDVSDDLWITVVRVAGAFHFVTLVMACFTPIPPNWDENLATLPETHRRFAIAQNVFIGGVIAFCGVVCLFLAPELVAGSPLARLVSGGIALWWGGRLVVLPWLKVIPHLASPGLKVGFVLLLVECAVYATGFGWLALRR
jgi:hypothetical protein